MSSLYAFTRILRDAPSVSVALLLFLMVLSGLTEGIGILLLLPLLEILQNQDAGNSPLARAMLTALSRLGIPPTAAGLLTLFVGLVLLRSAIQHGRIVLGASLQYRLVDRLRYRSFSALLDAEWRWLAVNRNSDHANLLLTDAYRVGGVLNLGLALLARAATILAYLISAFALSWEMTLIALVSGGAVLTLMSAQRRDALRLGRNLGKSRRALHANVEESLAGIKLAKILGNETRHLDLFHQMTSRLRGDQMHFQVKISQAQAIYQIVGAALLAGYIYMGLAVLHTAVAQLLTLVLVFGRLIPMFASGQQQYHQWLHELPALEETERLLAECKAVAEPKNSTEQSLWQVRESVCLKDVSVRYVDRDLPALDSVSVCFQARTTTAIMGASGAGKSTLADVLMGLLCPDSGSLSIDGEKVEGPKRRQWRHSVAYVPQDVFLFNDSIRNNLLWGRRDANEDDLRHALEQASANFVSHLPQGLETVVGDGGVRLSGGERQRLALARALLKRPSLLILDEATSALDLENEARVRTAIENLRGDLTVVIIGHRLLTLEHADKIVILGAGKIVEQGTWADTMDKQGRGAI